jgi:hypothetical protein
MSAILGCCSAPKTIRLARSTRKLICFYLIPVRRPRRLSNESRNKVLRILVRPLDVALTLSFMFRQVFIAKGTTKGGGGDDHDMLQIWDYRGIFGIHVDLLC